MLKKQEEPRTQPSQTYFFFFLAEFLIVKHVYVCVCSYMGAAYASIKIKRAFTCAFTRVLGFSVDENDALGESPGVTLY